MALNSPLSSRTLQLLPLLPVLTSTASVTFTLTEYWTFLPLLRPDVPPSTLSPFWNSYLYLTIPGWAGFGLTSAISGYISYQRLTKGLPKTLYGWGVVLALAHYAFGYSVMRIIERVVHGPPEKAKGELRGWLRVHTVRTLLVDVPAMVCFLGGFVGLI